MLQLDEPQPPAEAVALQAALRRAPVPIANYLTTTMAARSRYLSTSRDTLAVLRTSVTTRPRR
jgi:hypothetical protein